mgnify:CR=1 FL=1
MPITGIATLSSKLPEAPAQAIVALVAVAEATFTVPGGVGGVVSEGGFEALLEVRSHVPVPVEFVARSHLPLLGHEAQLEIMQQLAEGVAPHV